ncbi:hypothetical protein SAMD00023353_0602130 [Rosellinia necatrix]|uniref:Uncharacterized protein n=1 Tax=Rosellinia necatrix TaxID=77044 RepID=A0A1S7UL59_ROSNE|nr:hypothetical protein SAMD00023353_0602130 [Rosellinia necatrix]
MAEPRLLNLPEVALDALAPLKESLRLATYKPLLDYEICVAEEVIKDVIPFVNHLPPPAGNVSYPEIRVNVVHFIKSASIPVPPESTAMIVPVHVATEGAKIAGCALAPGNYWEITKEEQVEPDFYALLVLFQKS